MLLCRSSLIIWLILCDHGVIMGHFSWFLVDSLKELSYLNSLWVNFELYIMNFVAPVMVVNYYDIFYKSNQVTDIFEKRGLFINNIMIYISKETQVWIQIQLLADHS